MLASFTIGYMIVGLLLVLLSFYVVYKDYKNPKFSHYSSFEFSLALIFIFTLWPILIIYTIFEKTK